MRFDRLALLGLLALHGSGIDMFGNNHGGSLVVGAQEDEPAEPQEEAAEAVPEAGEAVPEQQEEDVSYVPPSNAEQYKFEAEVHRMLDIVVNSLYQNKDVFLRELISNASDALDKMRLLALQAGSPPPDDLEIRLEFDEDAQTLTIRDTGIGMTHDELVENLGTVARSGTTRFLEAFSQSSSNTETNLIGQFGVGFYSAFLVADRVTVASKHYQGDSQFVWETVNGASDFHVYPDPRGNTLTRGTEITLHLKEDCTEYADDDRLNQLARHYSEFVIHPIYMRKTELVEAEEEEEEETQEEEKKDQEDDELEVGEDEDEDQEDKPPKEPKMITTHSWDEINTNPAIWTREKETVSDDEYQSFYHVLMSNEAENATSWTHFNAEGNINFKSLLYLPTEVPSVYRFGNIDNIPGAMRLYVRKVLISDEFDLMPKYLGFIRGVVDSDDLPLNVNRETLQESKIIQVIKKKLVRKVLDMIKTLAKADDGDKGEDEQEEEEKDETEDEQDEQEEEKDATKYLDWYKKFSPMLKMGVIEDEANRNKLLKLLRFQTSKSADKFIGLEQYEENMKDWQDEVYVLAGLSLDDVRQSHFLEPFREKDVEVIYLTEAVDEYVISHVREFKGNRFVHISSENVQFKDEDEDMRKRRDKYYKNKFKPLTQWLKILYGDHVSRISVSRRLGSTPAIVSSGQWGHSANMERIMRAQAYTQGRDEAQSRASRVFEINPRHPLVVSMLESMPENDPDSPVQVMSPSDETADAAWMLLDMAMMNGGFPLADPSAHSRRLTKFMQSKMGVETLALEPEVDPPIEDEEAPDDFDSDGLNMDDIDLPDMDDLEAMRNLNMDDLDLDMDAPADMDMDADAHEEL